MLFNAETISAIVRALMARYRDVPPIVCDPVCVSTSGHTLLLPEALGVMMQELFPLATIVTPNKSEAEALLACGGRAITITSIEDMILASTQLVECGCRAVLLKGGHITISPSDIDRVASTFPNIIVKRFGLPLENTEILQAHGALPPCERLVVDVLCQKNGETALFVRPQIETKNTHGTGCTLSSALACELARGAGRKWSIQVKVNNRRMILVMEATQNATTYVHLGITTAPALGKGNGPLNHLHSIQRIQLLCK